MGQSPNWGQKGENYNFRNNPINRGIHFAVNTKMIILSTTSNTETHKTTQL